MKKKVQNRDIIPQENPRVLQEAKNGNEESDFITEKSTRVMVYLGGLVGMMALLIILWTDADIIGKGSVVILFEGLIIFIWKREKDKAAKKLLRWVGGVFTIFIVIWGVYSIYHLLQTMEAKRLAILNDRTKTPFFADSDKDQYKILILPFKTYLKEGGPDIGEILYDRLRIINKKEKLNSNIVYWEQFSTNDFENLADSADYWKKFHHADLIIYGRFYPSKIDSIDCMINYIANEDDHFGSLSKNLNTNLLPTSLRGLNRGELQGSIDFIMQFITGLRDFHRFHFSEAIGRLNKVKNGYNADKIDYLIGTSYMFVNLDSATIYLKDAIVKNTNLFEAHFNLSTLYSTTGKIADALKESEISVSLHKNDPLAYYGRGLIKRSLKDYSGALEDFSIAIKFYPNYDYAFSERAFTEAILQDWKEAIDDWTTAIRINPNSYIDHNNRAQIRATLHDYEGSIQDLTMAIEINPNRYEAYLNRGITKCECGANGSAYDDFTRVIEINPKNEQAFYNRGVLKQDKRDYKGAIDDYTNAINIDPGQVAYYYYNRGSAKWALKDLSGAMIDYNRAVEIDPHKADVYCDRGILKGELKNQRAGIIDLSKAIKIDPNMFKAYLWRGIANIEIHNYKSARYDLSRAYKLIPTDMYAQKYLKIAEEKLKRKS
jgi:tetratricopeptide (TPR) repeat protein